MNSFFIQPDIPEATRTILADQIRLAATKSRVEAEVWQTENVRSELQTAIGQSSPTIIPVGSRAWFDQIVTTAYKLSGDDLPVFGYVKFSPSQLHPLSSFLIGREIRGAIGSLAARKVSRLPLFSVNDDLFSESFCLGANETGDLSGSFAIKLSLQLNHGQIIIDTQASRIDFSLLDTIQDESPLIRLGIRSEINPQTTSSSIATDLLPKNRTSLRTDRYEDVLHIPIERGTLVAKQSLIGISHSHITYQDVLNVKLFTLRLRCITSKNQPHRY